MFPKCGYTSSIPCALWDLTTLPSRCGPNYPLLKSEVACN